MKIKKSIIAMFAIIIAAFTAHGQENKNDYDKNKKETASIKPFENVNDSVKSQIGNLLADYFRIKDALITGDDNTASTNAKAFRKTLESVDVKIMTEEQRAFFKPLQVKLNDDAEHIQGSSKIDHMREHFVSFSDNMWSLIKAFNANNGNTIYFAHCPMYKKGANWISDQSAIKNPYYGKQMLTCGKVTETIK